MVGSGTIDSIRKQLMKCGNGNCGVLRKEDVAVVEPAVHSVQYYDSIIQDLTRKKQALVESMTHKAAESLCKLHHGTTYERNQKGYIDARRRVVELSLTHKLEKVCEVLDLLDNKCTLQGHVQLVRDICKEV